MRNRRYQVLRILALVAFVSITIGCKKEPAQQQSSSSSSQAVPAVPMKPVEKAPVPAVASAAAEGKTQMAQPAVKLEGLTWIKGEPVVFQEGKVYVVEFWATWCGPCKTTIPHLTEVQKKFKDQGVTVVGISNEARSIEKVKAFVAEQGDNMNYTVAVDVAGTVEAGYMKAYQQLGIPTAFIVDGAGKVVWYGHPLADMDEVLTQVIAGTFDMASYATAKAEREALQRKVHASIMEYITGLRDGKPVEQTRPIADKLIETAPADILNQIAWFMLTELDEANRDYPTALKLAEKANNLTEGKEASLLDTYALALFKNGKIKEAVDAQTKAIELAENNIQMQDELKARLDEFKAAMKQ
ncbi:MAG: redoxin domain-containing protein [Sedimentisphaerales bacterium]|nr:redoxin domain-containing protein [Sedimentisphaerales bacterium]